MLKAALLTLALALSGGGLKGRAEKIIDEVVVVADKADVSVFYPELKDKPEEAKEKLARLLVAWSYWESTWDFKAIGDNGRSCGIMQVATSRAESCSSLTASAHAGLASGLQKLEFLVKRCGGLKPALGAYASGKCGGVPNLVERRCKVSGGC